MKAEILETGQYNAWNDFVDRSPQGDVFCYSWWLDAITDSGFRIYVIKENGEIVAGMPLAFDSFRKINLPPLTRTLGVLFADSKDETGRKISTSHRKCLSLLLDNINPDEFVQTCAHHEFNDWLPYRWKGLSQTTRYTYLLNFRDRSINEISENLDNLRKRTIATARKNGIQTTISSDFSVVYRFAEMSYRRQGLNFNLPFGELKRLDDAIERRGKRVIFTALKENVIHAVLYIAFNKRSAYYLLSGSDPELRGQGGHTLVMWDAIEYFHDKVEYFNFGGSDIENIESHVRGFGGIQTPYFHIFNKNNIHQTELRHHLKRSMFHLSAAAKALMLRFTR